jgi:hypothetical protein
VSICDSFEDKYKENQLRLKFSFILEVFNKEQLWRNAGELAIRIEMEKRLNLHFLNRSKP